MAVCIIMILGAYLIGSIPFGLLVAKLKGVDIRQHGSGNIGATNVFRTLGPSLGILVFVLDLLKGAFPIWMASQITDNPYIIILAGAAAILGHSFPIFLKFKGGKSVATGLGVLLGIAPEIFAAAFILAVLIIAVTRYVSLASIFVPILVVLAFWIMNKPLPYTILAALATALILIRHIPNMKRLMAGTEAKIGT